jgi:hypothetical protein
MKRAIVPAISAFAALLLAAGVGAQAAEGSTSPPPAAAAQASPYEPKRVQTSRIQMPHIEAQAAILYDDPPPGPPKATWFHAGTVLWRIDTPAPPDPPTIRAEILIGGRFTMTLALRRNADPQVTATETIEIAVSPQAGAAHGQVVALQGLFTMALPGAQAAPLIGRRVATEPNHFVYGLSAFAGDTARNIALLRKQPGLDLRLVYEDGHGAWLTLAKGPEGERIFTDAIDAWEKADLDVNGTHVR